MATVHSCAYKILRLTKAEGEGISSKPTVTNTVEGTISSVSTDALSTETTGGEATWICPSNHKYDNNLLFVGSM